MKKQETDWEVLILAIFVFALGIASLWEALLPRLPVLARDFLLALGLLLALTGSYAIYVEPHLGSQRSLWVDVAKDVAIAIAFFVLGLVLRR